MDPMDRMIQKVMTEGGLSGFVVIDYEKDNGVLRHTINPDPTLYANRLKSQRDRMVALSADDFARALVVARERLDKCNPDKAGEVTIETVAAAAANIMASLDRRLAPDYQPNPNRTRKVPGARGVVETAAGDRQLRGVATCKARPVPGQPTPDPKPLRKSAPVTVCREVLEGMTATPYRQFKPDQIVRIAYGGEIVTRD